MQIVDFTAAYIEQAMHIAKQNYEMERGFVPALPLVDQWPDLEPLAANTLGVAALDGGDVVGFLCGNGVWENAWGISGLRNVFSPIHANGTILANRAKIYARLYQAAGEKWARAGAASHSICLYAHDTEGQAQFYRYGFGMRCIDAIRPMDDIIARPNRVYTFTELAQEELIDVFPLEKLLDEGYIESPFFMYRKPGSEDDFLVKAACFQSIYFVAKYQGQAVAFIRAELDGETFIKDAPGYLHCKGLYCMPEHRGKGISQYLLMLLVQKLKILGYTRLGVDFESINPSGSGFWLKHFSAYTHSIVRRIDENAIAKR